MTVGGKFHERTRRPGAVLFNRSPGKCASILRKIPWSFVSPSTSTSPLYEHSCRLPERTLWFGRASLYEDRVTIRGWTWRGRFRRDIPIERIDDLNWRPVPDGPNLVLHLHDGADVAFRLESGAGLWNARLHELIGKSLLDKTSLSEDGAVGGAAGDDSS